MQSGQHGRKSKFAFYLSFRSLPPQFNMFIRKGIFLLFCSHFYKPSGLILCEGRWNASRLSLLIQHILPTLSAGQRNPRILSSFFRHYNGPLFPVVRWSTCGSPRCQSPLLQLHNPQSKDLEISLPFKNALDFEESKTQLNDTRYHSQILNDLPSMYHLREGLP